MSTPRLLGDITKAWNSVGADYEKGRLATEADLQASLYHHLRDKLPKQTRRRIFLTSQIPLDHGKIVPDLCLVDGETWVVELKAQNRNDQGVRWQDDYEKFGRIHTALSSSAIVVSSRLGVKFELRRPVFFLFGAIADASCEAVDVDRIRKNPKTIGLLGSAEPVTYTAAIVRDGKGPPHVSPVWSRRARKSVRRLAALCTKKAAAPAVKLIQGMPESPS